MCKQMAERRLRRELREVLDSKESVTVRVIDPTNIFHVQGFILSPEYAPTANYIFSLDIYFDEKYPFRPPTITARNKIWHPKIRSSQQGFGAICLAAATPEGWIPSTRLTTLLLSIQTLLGNPGELESGYLNRDAFEDICSIEKPTIRQP